jgi:hypothetical protein
VSLSLSLCVCVCVSLSLSVSLSCVCVAERRATRPSGEWRYSTRRHMLEPDRPEAVRPDRALCLPTFSDFLIVNKLLSLARARARAPALWARLSRSLYFNKNSLNYLRQQKQS